MRRTEAQRRNASALRLRHSQSLARRRQRLSRAMVRSTIHRLGRTAKPSATSDRLTISTSTRRRARRRPAWNRGPGVAAIGVELEQEGVEPEEAGHQQHASIAVLDVGRMHDGVQQQALRVYQDVALLALDLLARIVPVPVDAGSPFSALFTLWLSMIAAVGLASRPAFSRHWT